MNALYIITPYTMILGLGWEGNCLYMCISLAHSTNNVTLRRAAAYIWTLKCMEEDDWLTL